jgi:hypothetical protein
MTDIEQLCGEFGLTEKFDFIKAGKFKLTG